MTDYREKYLQAKDEEEELPIIPDYAGECFLKIAERLSHRPNFIVFVKLKNKKNKKLDFLSKTCYNKSVMVWIGIV